MRDVAIVGAGPYGLSVAAHLAHRDVDFAISGPPMDSWANHMPAGMIFKSDGFATSISAPEPGWGLGDYCDRAGVPYGDRSPRVVLERFVDYGRAFQAEFAPQLDPRLVTGITALEGGFELVVGGVDTVQARRVVLAVGITHFGHIPDSLVGLGNHVTHSTAHRVFGQFAGKRVAVVGAGSSAVEVAAALLDAGATVTMLARRHEIPFWPRSEGAGQRSLLDRIRNPNSGLGPGMRNRLCEQFPWAFRFLPAQKRVHLGQNHLGPVSGWWMREKVMTGVDVRTSTVIEGASLDGEEAVLHLAGPAGRGSLRVDHVIAATGFRADVDRLAFLDPDLRARIARTGAMPRLSSRFESSVPGLYFVGVAANSTFGPLMRFVVGAQFAASRVAADIGSQLPAKATSR